MFSHVADERNEAPLTSAATTALPGSHGFMIGRALSAVFIFCVRGYQLLISPWLGQQLSP